MFPEAFRQMLPIAYSPATPFELASVEKIKRNRRFGAFEAISAARMPGFEAVKQKFRQAAPPYKAVISTPGTSRS
jgi:hypothetical protein